MFWYQCRYCKVNFDQWEKLVTHRRDEHRQEFEALKRRSALLLKRQEEADTINKSVRLEARRKASEIVKSLETSVTPVCTNKMKPTSSCTSPNLSSSLASLSRRSQNSFSKELDAKDLENQEIALCIPSSSSINLRSSSVSPAFVRSSTPPFSFPTPSPSPRMNGSNNRTPRSSSKNGCSENNDHPIQPPSFLTPPVTPSRVASALSSSPSPVNSAEELALNWSPPADLKKVVQYHQMSDDDEIEICVIPSAGSCISVTKHSPSVSNRTATRHPPPYATINGGGGSNSVGFPNIYLNGDDQPAVLSHQQISNSHVVIESLEDELRMTCSSNLNDSINNGTSNEETRRQESNAKTSTAIAPFSQGVRRRSHVEMLRSTGQRLKRLHSQLQQRQNQHQINRSVFASHSSSSASSSTPTADSNDDNEVTRKRIRSSSNPANDENRVGIQSERLSRSSSNNNASTLTTPRFSRHSTRASPRRPK